MRRTKPETPDAAVARVAARQHGNITYEQLLSCGLTRTAIDRRVRNGRLHRVHIGVYAVGRPPNLPLERASAAVLACGRGAALSHTGALALWGFTKRWPASFDVVVMAGDRRPAGVATHRYTNLLRRDLRVQLGIRATSPARTLLDCAPRLEPGNRARTVNDALHGPFVSQSQLGDVRHRFPTHPGAKLLDRFLDGHNPTRSPFEDDFLAFCARHNLPCPQVNVRVAGHTVDALFEPHHLIVELDSWEFHKERETFETDRDRDADTLHAGYRTLRITWDRLHHRAEAEARRLREMLG
jgi:Transcriptional regulator, AbiEi antitoxin